MVGDGGGKAPQWAQRIVGLENVAQVLMAMSGPFQAIGGTVEPRQVNGQPGAVFRDRDGRVVNAMALDVVPGGVQTIRSVINPDKLGHVGPVADAWSVLREANRGRLASGGAPLPPLANATSRSERGTYRHSSRIKGFVARICTVVTKASQLRSAHGPRPAFRRAGARAA